MLKTRNLMMTGMLVSLIIISAFIKIPMIPVPLTLTYASVNLVCLISDKKISFLSVLIYIIIGLLGIPVFSQGGGIGYIFNPTFGYLIGFLIMPFSSGFFKKRVKKEKINFLNNLIISVVNILIVYICGLLYALFVLKTFFVMSYSCSQFLTLFMLIFIPGDTIMAIITSFLGIRLKRIVKIY